MANISPKTDALDFAKRLREAMTDCGMNTGRGAGPMLARRYGVSTVNANAWLKGAYQPDTDRAKRMAEDFGVRFEWLYFGTGSKKSITSVEEPRSAYASSAHLLNAHEQAVFKAYRNADLATREVIDRLLNIQARTDKKSRKK